MAFKHGTASAPVYTTHQVAKMLGVSLPTVVNWTRDGRMEAHRTPGGHRRIREDELVRFAQEYQMPLPPQIRQPVVEGDSGVRRVLVVDREGDFAEMVCEFLESGSGFHAQAVSSAFEAGLALGLIRPRVVILDLDMPDLDAKGVIRTLAETAGLASVATIVTTSLRSHQQDQELKGAGVFGILHKPVKLEELVAMVEEANRAVTE